MDRPAEPIVSRTSDPPAAPRGFGRRAPAGAPAPRLVYPAAPAAADARSVTASPPADRAISDDSLLARSLPTDALPAHAVPADAIPAAAVPPAARETYDPPPLPPIMRPETKIAPPPGRARKRIIGLLLLLLVGLGGIYAMQSARAGLPDCGSTDATDTLRQMTRGVLAKQNIAAREIQFAEIAGMTPDAEGVKKCRAVLVVDGQPMANLVYQLSWTLRLVVYNRFELKVIAATQI